MTVSPVWRRELTASVERILHSQGNYRGGNLEMALVLDYQVPAEELSARAGEILAVLKSHSEVFRNVRLNVVKWTSDGQIHKEISAIAKVQMGTVFEDYQTLKPDGTEVGGLPGERALEELMFQLKFYYARSKLVLILTDGHYEVKDAGELKKNLQPFLCRKMLIMQDRKIITGISVLQESIING